MDGDDDDDHYRNVSSTCSDGSLEKLITEVKKYPCLYAIHSLQYRDVAAKERSWNEISKQSNRHSSGLKKEWKKLRDCYRQSLVTRIRNDSKKKNLRPWKFEKQMEFLKPYITPRSRHLDGSQTSSEAEFDAPNNVTVKQEPTSDDDSSYLTEAGTSSSQAEDMPPTRRLLRSQVRPSPSSSKPPRKRNKKEKSSTPSNDIPTQYSSSSSTPTHAGEKDRNKPSTSSQDKNSHVSYTCSSDMNVEEDNSQEPGPITTIDDSIQMATSLAIVDNIIENCKVKPVTTTLNNTFSTVTTTLTNNTLSTVATTLTNNTLSTVTTTHVNNNLSTFTTTFGNNTVPTVTTTIGNNTLPASTLVGNTFPTTTLGDNTLPPDINTLENNSTRPPHININENISTRPPHINTLENNSTRPPHINSLENNTKTNNSFPKNANVYGTNIHPTITYQNGGRIKYSYPFNMLGNISQLQSNSALRNSNTAYPPTVGSFQNSNNTPSTSTGPLLNSNMQRIIHPYLNGFIDPTGQLHSFIIPIPLRSVGIDAKTTNIKSVCKSSSTGPPVAGNLDNNKLPKVGFSHYVDIIGSNNQCQLYKLTPKSTSTVSNNNIQQDNSMDTSISYNHGNGKSKSASTGSNSYGPPSTDLNTNNGSTQTDGTFEDKNHLQSADSRSNSAHLPSTENLVGDVNNGRIQLVDNNDRLQSISSIGNKNNPQSDDSCSNNDQVPSAMDIGNDCLTFERTFGNTSLQKFSVSTQTTSPTCIDCQEHGALQLFFSSMYESTKKLPVNYQNTIKKELFDSVLSAEKKHHAY